jgi:amino acid transporter
MVAASRVAFAYARDDCFGSLSRPLKAVNRHTLTPVNAVWFNAIIGILLLLLVFGGAAIDAIFSIGAIAAYVAFTTPIFIKIVVVRNDFRRGPVSNVRSLKPQRELFPLGLDAGRDPRLWCSIQVAAFTSSQDTCYNH